MLLFCFRPKISHFFNLVRLLGNVTDSISENVESTTQFIGGKKDDEYFCKETKDYRICRHCPSIDDSGKVIYPSTQRNIVPLLILGQMS